MFTTSQRCWIWWKHRQSVRPITTELACWPITADWFTREGSLIVTWYKTERFWKTLKLVLQKWTVWSLIQFEKKTYPSTRTLKIKVNYYWNPYRPKKPTTSFVWQEANPISTKRPWAGQRAGLSEPHTRSGCSLAYAYTHTFYFGLQM